MGQPIEGSNPSLSATPRCSRALHLPPRSPRTEPGALPEPAPRHTCDERTLPGAQNGSAAQTAQPSDSDQATRAATSLSDACLKVDGVSIAASASPCFRASESAITSPAARWNVACNALTLS